jgi:hypothetical protein
MSGWNSKKSMSNLRFSWTQPYRIQPIQYSSVSKEMAIIEAIDRLIDSGLTYPELGTIIKHIANNSRSNPNA